MVKSSWKWIRKYEEIKVYNIMEKILKGGNRDMKVIYLIAELNKKVYGNITGF
jgi:hypothetical protein